MLNRPGTRTRSMRTTWLQQVFRLGLIGAIACGVFGADLLAHGSRSTASAGSPPRQVVYTPYGETTIGPARNWGDVDYNYQYYYGPNYRYDSGWYAQRHLAHPNNYVTYAYDPANVCSTEYYYMPDDGVYYCYTPDPVALNSNLQTGCPNQPYLYFCPNDLR